MTCNPPVFIRARVRKERGNLTDPQRVVLARRARTSLEACRAALAADGFHERARRHAVAGEDWSSPLRELLAEAKRADAPHWREAHEQWSFCERRWWRLARSIAYVAKAEARRHARRWTVLGADDLEVYGLIGLYRAAQSWNPGAGANFRTFGGTMARLRMQIALRDLGGDEVAIPTGKVVLANRLRHELDALETAGLPRYLPWAAEAAGVPLEEASRLMTARERCARFDQPMNPDSDATLGDFLTIDDPLGPVDEHLARRAEADHLHDLIDVKLPERTAYVIRELLADEPRSAADIGRRLGLSRERVRQIAVKGIRTLATELGVDLDTLPRSLSVLLGDRTAKAPDVSTIAGAA